MMTSDRQVIVAANWKMHKNSEDAVMFIDKIKKMDFLETEVIIAPSFTLLASCKEAAKDSAVKISGQNMYHEANGAFTGEISPSMVKEYADYVMLGHSERRHIFGETDEMINRKMHAAISEDLIPILCVGETLEERDEGKTSNIIGRQLEKGLDNIKEDEAKNMIIAYEPVWAIGTGKVATPEQAEEAHKFIRERISGLYSEGTANIIPILYGGSVKPDNFKELLAEENIDGGLVGGASLDADSFSKLIKIGRGND